MNLHGVFSIQRNKTIKFSHKRLSEYVSRSCSLWSNPAMVPEEHSRQEKLVAQVPNWESTIWRVVPDQNWGRRNQVIRNWWVDSSQNVLHFIFIQSAKHNQISQKPQCSAIHYVKLDCFCSQLTQKPHSLNHSQPAPWKIRHKRRDIHRLFGISLISNRSAYAFVFFCLRWRLFSLCFNLFPAPRGIKEVLRQEQNKVMSFSGNHAHIAAQRGFTQTGMTFVSQSFWLNTHTCTLKLPCLLLLAGRSVHGTQKQTQLQITISDCKLQLVFKIDISDEAGTNLFILQSKWEIPGEMTWVWAGHQNEVLKCKKRPVIVILLYILVQHRTHMQRNIVPVGWRGVWSVHHDDDSRATHFGWLQPYGLKIKKTREQNNGRPRM